MKDTPQWDDYAYFTAIARTGGLQRAADALGVSPATLSRRMRAFEVRIGRRLFQHGADGYSLTPDGIALLSQTDRMEAVARDISSWATRSEGPVCVRISAGTWTAHDLVLNIAAYWNRDAIWLPEFVSSEATLDIARREIDIGIRGARPTQPWLAGQHVARVQYAAYARDAGVTGWIGPAHGAPDIASNRWIIREHGDDIVTKANSSMLRAEMARAGIGRVTLPTFIGDRMEGVIRVSDPIEELASTQWLISHQDGRNEPAVRAALDALAGYLKARESTGA
ncbi:MAG: LysR family transcriptional regulator [Rhodobacteraceae bacterium]|nr:LysR family transcriptional regulator [Paracoccaceae bacterium]